MSTWSVYRWTSICMFTTSNQFSIYSGKDTRYFNHIFYSISATGMFLNISLRGRIVAQAIMGSLGWSEIDKRAQGPVQGVDQSIGNFKKGITCRGLEGQWNGTHRQNSWLSLPCPICSNENSEFSGGLPGVVWVAPQSVLRGISQQVSIFVTLGIRDNFYILK